MPTAFVADKINDGDSNVIDTDFNPDKFRAGGVERNHNTRPPRTLSAIRALGFRVLDGESGARFLNDVATVLREPALSLLF